MAWSAVVRETKLEGNQFLSMVSITDGSTVYDCGFYHSGTTPSLRRAVRTWIESMDTQVAVRAQVPPGHVIDCTPIVPPPPTPPTQSEAARAEFAASWRSFCYYDNAVSARCLAPSDPLYVDALSTMTKLWRASYADLCVSI